MANEPESYRIAVHLVSGATFYSAETDADPAAMKVVIQEVADDRRKGQFNFEDPDGRYCVFPADKICCIELIPSS